MKNRLTITILVDNHAQEGLQSEHGFAVLIEHNSKRILFDTGQNEVLFYNAEKLDVALTGLDDIILSHGHYDHGGNIEWLLKNNPDATLHLHPDCLQTRYSIADPKNPRNISLTSNTISAIQQSLQSRINVKSQPSQIRSAINLTGEITRKQPLELSSGPFYLDKQRQKEDFLLDDQSLWIETKQGLLIITGCCHAGIENSVRQILTQASNQSVHTIIGGLHLHNANEQRLKHSAKFLASLKLKQLYPAHCSGENAQKLLNQQLGHTIVKDCKAGLTLSFELPESPLLY